MGLIFNKVVQYSKVENREINFSDICAQVQLICSFIHNRSYFVYYVQLTLLSSSSFYISVNYTKYDTSQQKTNIVQPSNAVLVLTFDTS